MLYHISVFLAALATAVSASIQDPQIAPRPPMGYNNWARFQCNLNESLFTTTADLMISKGFLAAGYNNINLDDCWSLKERNAQGELEWNTTIFPHGMPWLGSYLHTRGFNFGIYTNAGNTTCGGYPGSQDHEETDIQTFARWGVDYLKLDGCNMDLQNGRSYYQEFEYRYKLWHSILTTELERPFIFSQSAPAYFSPNFHLDKNNTNWYRTMSYMRSNGELARHSDDVKVYGNNPTNTFEPGGHWASIMNNYDKQVRLARYQSCGFFNDPDFLIVDWPDLSLDEKKSHFALWSSFSAPLILSAWMPDVTDEDIEYLTNQDIIAVDQDARCEQATLVSQSEEQVDVLTKNLANRERLVTVLNRGNETREIAVPLSHMGVEDKSHGRHAPLCKAKDLWTGTMRRFSRELSVRLRKHQTGIYRVSSSIPSDDAFSITPTGQIFNTFSMNCLSASSSRRHLRHPHHPCASPGSVVFETCKSDDSQIWRISEEGLISPLSDKGLCLNVDSYDDDGGGIFVGLEECDESDENQMWSYGVSGNLASRSMGLCLQEQEGKEDEERGGREAVARECGVALDSQVYALPGGVKLEN